MIRLLLGFFAAALLCCNTASAQTGMTIPEFKKADSLIPAFMKKYGITGGTAAISYNGKLVYSRAFGFEDQAGTKTAYPHNLYRIASISKPITAIGIMMLVEQGKLSLTDTVFGTGKIIDHSFYTGVITDNRIYNITVQQLLEHTAGWDRDVSCDGFSGCDPISFPLHVTNTFGAPNPVADSLLIKFLLQKGLNFTPGSKYAYSNIGYLVLAKIIERKSGMTYEDYMQSQVFSRMGICDMKIAKSLLKDKHEREMEYMATGTTRSSYDSSTVPWQYGGLNIEAMHAHGGWATTARDMVKLFLAVDSFNTYPDILQPATITAMTKPSTVNGNYAKGWSVNNSYHWWHTGSLPGTATVAVRTRTGYIWSFMFNNRATASNAFWIDLDNLPWNCISGVTPPSTVNLFAPEKNAVIVNAAGPSATANISWTNGSGDGRLVVVHEDSVLTSFPLDSVSYTANSQYGSGSNLGGNAYVVYDGGGTNVSTGGYTPGSKQYWATVFEYYENTNTLNGKVYKLDCRSTKKLDFQVGINDVSLAQVTVIPNPATTSIRIAGLNANSSVELHDCVGKMMLRADVANNGYVDISQLPAGVYIATIKSGAAQVSRKVVKL